MHYAMKHLFKVDGMRIMAGSGHGRSHGWHCALLWIINRNIRMEVSVQDKELYLRITYTMSMAKQFNEEII